MLDNADFVQFHPGDTFGYRSVTTRQWITWTRDEKGRWEADDGREVIASDLDVRLNMEGDGSLLTCPHNGRIED